MELLTGAEMRRFEADAMAQGAVSGRQLMERAGAGVVAALIAEWPDLAARAQAAAAARAAQPGPVQGGVTLAEVTLAEVTLDAAAFAGAALAGETSAGATLTTRPAAGATGNGWPVSGSPVSGWPGDGWTDDTSAGAAGSAQSGAPRALVLCGPGGNGGDGYVIARLLHEAGWQLRVLALGGASRPGSDAEECRRRWEVLGPVYSLDALPGQILPALGVPGEQAPDQQTADQQTTDHQTTGQQMPGQQMPAAHLPGEPAPRGKLRGGKVQGAPGADEAPPRDLHIDARFGTGAGRALPEDLQAPARQADEAPPADILVDALFGTGIGRALPEGLQALIRAANVRADGGAPLWHRVVAVDLPSGLHADSGRLLASGPEAVLKADLTVSFSTGRAGHLLGFGPQLCGRLVVAPLGIAGEAVLARGFPARPGAAGRALLVGGEDMAKALRKQSFGHKYGFGHVLVLAGGAHATGAARLAIRAALRAGAGVATLGAPAEALPEAAAQLTAVMLRQMDSAAELAGALADRRINALCLGPGMGVARAAALLPAALDRLGADWPGAGGAFRLVLDADALTALAQDPALRARLGPGAILTPHEGEFARLFPDLAAALKDPLLRVPGYSRIDAVREAAAATGATVLLKGPDTVIADPSGACLVHAAAYGREVPWLATAGAGDVLAGLIAGLGARLGAPDLSIAGLAAWLHVEAARSFGPGLIAEDLPEAVPAVFRQLGL